MPKQLAFGLAEPSRADEIAPTWSQTRDVDRLVHERAASACGVRPYTFQYAFVIGGRCAGRRT